MKHALNAHHSSLATHTQREKKQYSGQGVIVETIKNELVLCYIVHNVLHAVQARHIRSALQSVYGDEMHDSAAGVHFIPILHE